MTDSISAYPEDMKLSLYNVAAWENYVQKVISAYSDMGTAIRKNIPLSFIVQLLKTCSLRLMSACTTSFASYSDPLPQSPPHLKLPL